MKPGTARAFASRRRAHSRVPGPESLSLGSLGVARVTRKRKTNIPMKTTTTLAACAVAMATSNSTLRADNFGTIGNTFTIDFVNIGNPGNADYFGYGGVGYNYRMGTYEISQDAITKATASGLANVVAGAWAGNRPAALMTWYECAAFVNWLNTSTGHHAAYDLTFSGSWSKNLWSSAEAWQLDGQNLYRHKDAYYFLPNEDEWYKAAFHKNDGVTANYWNYATGSSSIPDGIDSGTDTVFDAVFADPFNQVSPNVVTNVGLGSAYGTFGQDGNVSEMMEGDYGAPYSDARVTRGGYWASPESSLRFPYRSSAIGPTTADESIGFRVASVIPEPASAILFLFCATAALATRRRRAH